MIFISEEEKAALSSNSSSGLPLVSFLHCHFAGHKKATNLAGGTYDSQLTRRINLKLGSNQLKRKAESSAASIGTLVEIKTELEVEGATLIPIK